MPIAESSQPNVLVTPRKRGMSGTIGINPLVCFGLLALLMVWAVIFPQTGDGDAILHFLSARDGLWHPAKLLGSWARVGAKIPLLIPAQFGILAARWMSAVVSVLCAWQTIRLAEDLGIKRAWLAGPTLIFQPFVFTLASDTMTELPLALGIVIAIRLWMARRTWASCLVMGYLPTVRPEGFFLCAMWAVMVIAARNGGPWNRRAGQVAALGWGTAIWLVACWMVHPNLHYFFTEWWNWPADSARIYGRGSLFAYADRWPMYCGPILFPAFVLGLIAGGLDWHGSVKSVLLWAFVLVFALHSVLWWRGWFGSCGLMRIMACIGPITAIVCLRGWNLAMDRLAPRWHVAGAAAMAAVAMGYYVAEPTHQRVFPLERACEFAANHGVLSGAPKILLGDPMAQVCLDLPPDPGNVMKNVCDRAGECKQFLNAPIGSAGFWDNQHAQAWFHVALSDLPELGYTVLFEARQRPAISIEWLEPANLPREQIYVVVRKDRPGTMPAD
jgi:hypothetical protein